MLEPETQLALEQRRPKGENIRSVCMALCVSNRSEKPLLLLTRVQKWLSQWIREALDLREDTEVTVLLTARTEVWRLLSELLKSYGGPSDPETRRRVRGFCLLSRVDDWLTYELVDARKMGSNESLGIWEARRTIRRLMPEVLVKG